jgi:hypothetical protein
MKSFFKNFRRNFKHKRLTPGLALAFLAVPVAAAVAVSLVFSGEAFAQKPSDSSRNITLSQQAQNEAQITRQNVSAKPSTQPPETTAAPETTVPQTTTPPATTTTPATTLPPVSAPQAGVLKYTEQGTVLFGEYEQDDNPENGKEPLEWLVIGREEGKVLLLTKYAIDSVRYHWDERQFMHITYEQSTLRAFLNGDFYQNNFTEEERAMVLLSQLQNQKNPKSGTRGGNATEDLFFLLSHEELNQYMTDTQQRRGVPTPYCLNKPSLCPWEKNNDGYCFWWLRTAGCQTWFAEYVWWNGTVYEYGSDVGHNQVCLRPAVWVAVEPSVN